MHTPGRDIISDLLRVHKMITSKPFPQALWFIDRDRTYRRVKAVLPELEQHPYVGGFLQAWGIPVHNWHSSEIRELIHELMDKRGWSLERVRRIYPLCQSGVWIQMNNGQHQHLEISP